MRLPVFGSGCGGPIEVVMIVVTAGWIERSGTVRAARIAVQISVDGKRRAAGTAQNRLFLPLCLRPRSERMIRERVVTVFARVEEAAAAHFDGDDVGRLVIVGATRFRIETKPVNAWRIGWHGHGRQRIYREPGKAQ